MRTLRLWFSFDVPVTRRAYLLNGAGLMLFKYAVDAALLWWFTGALWTPADYLSPLWEVRSQVFAQGPPWLGPGLILFTLPFLWIGVSMSARRAVDAGGSPWIALLFFVPGLNYLLMVGLSALPSKPRPERAPASPPAVDERLKSALLGVAASIGITLVSVGVGVYLRRAYSAGLFLGVPFTIGYISAYIYVRRVPQARGGQFTVGLASVLVACGAMIVFALEGLACTLMALPAALIIALPGALLGSAMARRIEPAAGAGMAALLAPLLVALEPRAAPVPHDVVTVVEIDAPPAIVWPHVVTFPDLAPPDEWWFRLGVAGPTRARIEGSGVGAVRYCDFTTGSFVEPVTAWEEGRRLAFAITEQAPPMRELSPYGDIRAPHLDGYFRATFGEFRLEELPGGRTRLVGTTRYEIDMFPQRYWTLFADEIVEAIHVRVLGHIERLAQAPRALSRSSAGSAAPHAR